jgi:carboxyl-terminal processing protease
MVENQLTVNVPIEGGPGYRAGLLPGDRITKIDGKGTQKLSLGESIRLLRGRPGVPVQIAIYRPSESKTIELSVIREMIQVPTLQETKMISAAESQGEKIGYVRITQFGEKTGKEFDGAMGKLEKDGATALILDLRDNPGGLVDAAVEVVSRFVPKGTLVVATEGRKAGAKRQEYLSREAALRVRWPTVVLVNGNTASAAEIVAGALQDLGLAVIVGETTFGKGSVQTVQRVDPSVIPDVGVRLTTAHYTTPSRKKIHGVGIQPDVVARLTRAEEEAIFQKRSPGLKKSSEEELEVNDEPLDRAIDLLRGWKVVKRRAVSDRSS